MNPSTQEILAAFENLPTDKVIILPNNKNIVMAAKQAQTSPSRGGSGAQQVHPQGLAAMLVHDPDGELAGGGSKDDAALATVKTGEITIATRSVEIDGVE